jgi:ABC-type oligopeptide transport system ATPase subunit
VRALDGVSFSAQRGEILALMGRNGVGKTTLLRALIGLTSIAGGSASVAGRDVAATATEGLARDVAFVPQDPASVLYHDSVEGEIADTLAGTGRAGTVEEALDEWALAELRRSHPSDLSAASGSGRAAALAGRPAVLLVNRRGAWTTTKRRLVVLARYEGATVIMTTMSAGGERGRVLLAEGRVVEEPARDVLTETLTFSTQVNKLLGGAFHAGRRDRGVGRSARMNGARASRGCYRAGGGVGGERGRAEERSTRALPHRERRSALRRCGRPALHHAGVVIVSRRDETYCVEFRRAVGRGAAAAHGAAAGAVRLRRAGVGGVPHR